MRQFPFFAVLCLLLLTAAAAPAAWLRPIQGSGNFYSIVDVANHWSESGQLDVVLMIAIPNRELSFEKEGTRLSGTVKVEVELVGWDGTVISGDKDVRLVADNEHEAGLGTLFQVFPVVLRDVPFRSGRLYCQLLDQNRSRIGLYNIIRKKKARSEIASDWSAHEQPRVDDGLVIGDPVFLAAAPIPYWREHGQRQRDFFAEDFVDFLHPTRRYGLEQESLQLYFEVRPPLRTTARAAAAQGLLVSIQAKDLDFVVRDTLDFDPESLDALGAGGTTGVYYDLDTNTLPPGSYHLSVGPANGEGRGWLVEFDVAWRLSTVTRHIDELLGEGRTVFFGADLERFLASTPPEQEIMLEKFWHGLDPDPETRTNEVYREFRRRVAYVRRHLNGFGRVGAIDPRGEVYVLLGPPDEVEINSMPLNATDQEDAVIKVYSPFAPDREGSAAKGFDPSGTQGITPYSREGGIPMPYSAQAENDILAKRTSLYRERAFERWEYNHAGKQLFANKYTGRILGLSFLFVDRTGSGDYQLESTNAWTGND